MRFALEIFTLEILQIEKKVNIIILQDNEPEIYEWNQAHSLQQEFRIHHSQSNIKDYINKEYNEVEDLQV